MHGYELRTRLKAVLGAFRAFSYGSLYPTLLRGAGDGSPSLLATGASSPRDGLVTALAWFSAGAPLAVVWFALNFRLHRPKEPVAADGEGY